MKPFALKIKNAARQSIRMRSYLEGIRNQRTLSSNCRMLSISTVMVNHPEAAAAAAAAANIDLPLTTLHAAASTFLPPLLVIVAARAVDHLRIRQKPPPFLPLSKSLIQLFSLGNETSSIIGCTN